MRVDSLRRLFASSDAVSIHCGLSTATTRSVDAGMLALLPDGGIVINTARGGIIDERALTAEAVAGRLLVGLDVVEHEDDWSTSPVAAAGTALLTGHGRWLALAGGPQPYSLPPFAESNLHAFRDGRPLQDLITVEAYDRTV